MKKGFTLLELVVTIAILGIVATMSFNLLYLGTKSHTLSVQEFQLQSDMRKTTEELTNVIRYSRAVFAVPQTFVSDVTKLDDGWSYIMLSPDKKKIISMDYDEVSKKHVERVISQAKKNIEYEVEFKKDTTPITLSNGEKSERDNVMHYVIRAYELDNKGNRLYEVDNSGARVAVSRVVFESMVESVNSVQVADKGTSSSPSVALAYRGDGKSGKGRSFAYITIIVDVSGSMYSKPNNGAANDDSSNPEDYSRIKNVRLALLGDSDSSKEGIIHKLTKEDNIFVSYVPFSLNANYPDPASSSTDKSLIHPIYDTKNKADVDDLVYKISSIMTSSVTNTGDGLRRAYHLHNNFRDRMKSKLNLTDADKVNHYTILLIDGETNYESLSVEILDEGGYYTVTSGSIKYQQWRPKSGKATILGYYTDDGNIAGYATAQYSSIGRTLVGATIDSSRYPFLYGKVTDIGSARNGKVYGPEFTKVKTAGYAQTYYSYGNTIYTDVIGSKFKDVENGQGVKSYLIAYARSLGPQIQNLGSGIGTESKNIYKYDDPGFDLNEVFESITTDILTDHFLATGPQIK